MKRALLLLATLLAAAAASSKECITSSGITSKLICYYSKARAVDACKCSYVILPETSSVDDLNKLSDKGVKVLLNVKAFNENLIKTIKQTKIFGLEVQIKKPQSRHDIVDFIATARTKLGGALFIALVVPPKPATLAKYYDFKTLSKHVDVFTLGTHFLGASRNVTFHPSRLSGLWDVQNTDSMVDLINGLGAPLNKLVITSPVQGFEFILQEATHTAPGSPALELSTITRDELCDIMESEKWTLERDQDQAGPYIFRDKKWIAFEDSTSMDIKAKYARVRGLAGLALKDLSQDASVTCAESLLNVAFLGLTKQARAPRGAVLQSLEREILEPAAKIFETVQVSPYRISRVVDTEGNVHVTRKDTRTEFQCTRQGYFVHPRSCNRFYRCVKFNQQSNDFSVFEFDCPAGLAFDERVEVCVWPGSLLDGSACAGSSEIAPVSKKRFVCPDTPGYYADPNNCRWFFACLDHGQSKLIPYEFRCPYGLVFDEERLLCEWAWLVAKCSFAAVVHDEYVNGGNGTPVSLSLETREGDYIDLYDGLGTLNHVKLGGLAGPLQHIQSKTYSNFDHSGEPEFYNQPRAFSNARDSQEHNFQTINIIAGGPSGVVSYPSTVNTPKHGLRIDVESIAPATLLSSGTFSLVPVVSPVPIPSATHFEKFNNYGVVANVPELQHKLTNPTIRNYEVESWINNTASTYGGIYTQAPQGFGSYKSETYEQPQVIIDDYKYQKPAVDFQHQALNPHAMKTYTYQQNFKGFDSYNDDKPKIAFKEGPVTSLGTTTYYEGNNYFGGYLYNKRTIKFEETPAVPVSQQLNYKDVALYSTIKHDQTPLQVYQGSKQVNHDGYYYNKPSIKFEEGSTIVYENNKYTSHTQFQGYKYQTPAIKFEEKPPTSQPFQPAAFYQYVNPDIQQQGYFYETPAIKFEEKPASSIFAKQEKHEGYHYETPTIKFEERPTVSIQQEVQYEGYVYKKPKNAFEETEIHHTTPHTPVASYQKVELQPTVVTMDQKTTEYHYDKPPIRFDEKPSVYQEISEVPQAVVSQTNSAIHVNHEHNEKSNIIFESKSQQPYQPVQNGGYYYEKPSIAFEEKPEQTYIPVINQKIKEQPATTYQEIRHEVQSSVPIAPHPSIIFQNKKHEGYYYEKPKVTFEERPRQIYLPPAELNVKAQPTTVYQEENHEEKPSIRVASLSKTQATAIDHDLKIEGYLYEKPKIVFDEKPQQTYLPIVKQKVHVQPTITPSAVHAHDINRQGYNYEKPRVVFKENTQQTYHPIVNQNVNLHQPALTYQEVHQVKPTIPVITNPEEHVHKYVITNQNIENEHYYVQKPQEPYIIQPTVSYLQVNQFSKQQEHRYETPRIKVEEKPVFGRTYQERHTQPQLVRGINYKGYYYKKPKVAFDDRSQQTYVPISTPTPSVAYIPHNKQEIIYDHSYSKAAVNQNIQSQTYQVKQPAVTYEQHYNVQQAANSADYHYDGSKIKLEEKPVPATNTYQETELQPIQPIVTQHYLKPEVTTYQQGYNYNKPNVVFEDTPLSTRFIPKPQPTPILTSYHEVMPLIMENKPIYKQVVQVITPKPAVVSNFSFGQYSEGYKYEKPTILYEEKPVVTYVPVKPSPIRPKLNPALQYIPPKPAVPPSKSYLPQTPTVRVHSTTLKPVQSYYQEYYNAKEIIEQPIVKVNTYQTGYHYEKPQIKFENTINPKSTASDVFKVDPAPLQFHAYDSSLGPQSQIGEKVDNVVPLAIQPGIAIPVPTVTTSKPIVRYEFSSLNHQNPIEPVAQKPLVIDVLDREYISITTTRRPLIVTSRKHYLPPSTPKRVYLPVATEKYTDITNPSREYLPVSQEILKIKQSRPANEYLPLPKKVRTTTTTTTVPSTTRTTKPSREYLPAKANTESLPQKSKFEDGIAKQIEYYEYKSSTETAPSSSRRPKIIKVIKSRPIVKVNDFHPILSAKLGAQCTCTSNILTLRSRRPQKTVIDNATTRNSDIEEYVTNEEDFDVSYNSPKKQSVIIVAEEEDEDINQEDEVRKHDIAKAVDSSFKLVKSAVKQGVKEGVQEALAGKDFDRFGPGGVRSRSETLQGNIDCQRAGLFRHPKHCNKFYSCRWDELKKKFTLHMFNCPVHLTFDNKLGACNWPSHGPACVNNILLPSD